MRGKQSRAKRRQENERKRLLMREIENSRAEDIRHYCANICGGKCCNVYQKGEKICECPQLTAEKTCAIYRERFLEGLPYSVKFLAPHRNRLHVVNITCGNVMDIIDAGDLLPEIAARCCYVHPELLDRCKDDKEQT